MAEIAVVRGTNDLKVVSTFSGCGGSCLGFEMDGYDVVWANEFIPAARETYALNHPGVILDGRDIRQVTPDEILEATGIEKGELDVFEGSPPCASFSTAGKRAKGWGKVHKYSDSKQRTDDLFFEYIRLLNGLRPKVFVAENVAGLVKGSAYGYFEMILQRMRACGYRVKVKRLDAQWLGVPQMRQRMIFIGVREDLGLDPVFPTPLPYRYVIGDALPDFHGTVQIGNPEHKQKPGNSFPRGILLKRTDVAYTFCASSTGMGGAPACVREPNGDERDMTIAECKRLCAFPDDFQLTGKYAQQWERLGRSVPPVMMAAVARTLREAVFSKLKRA